MSDTLGALQVPLPAPEDKTAVGDPLLDTTLAFLQAVINAKTKTAWKAVCANITRPASEPLPVVFAFPHCPTNESFSTGRLPALFAWRSKDHEPTSRGTQQWLLRESVLSLLWVPPRASQEQARVREPFKNAISAAMALAFQRGRDPSWVVPGDTYYNAATYGSTYREKAKLARYRLRSVEPHPIQIAFDDGPAETFDALLAQLEVWETLEWGDDVFAALDHVEGTTTTNGLELVDFVFKMAATAIAPSTGAHAGGTSITISGRQFSSGATVMLGGVACTNVTLVDESTITATTPAHALGAVDLVVTNPSGASSTLAAAFTFT